MSALRKITPSGIAVLWVLTRLWAVGSGMQILPYPLSQYLFSDVQLYDWWSSNIADGHFPLNDPMWQYPPLAALIFFAGFSLAANTVGFVALATLIDGLLMFTLIRACIAKGKGDFTPALIWLSAPLIMGPIILGRFDVFPTLVMVLGLLATSRPLVSGFWFSVGTLLKVWPGLGLLTVRRTDLVKAVSAFAVTSIAGSLLLKMWWPASFSFINGQRSRGLQIESVGALPYMWWNATSHVVKTEFRYGAIEVAARGTSIVSAIITLATIVLLGYVVRWRLQGKIDHVPAADVALYVVLVAMVTSRVLSPQYNVWIFGILAVCALEQGKNFQRITQAFFLSAFCGQILYPFAYVSYQGGEALPTIVQTIRIVALLYATFLAGQQLAQRASE